MKLLFLLLFLELPACALGQRGDLQFIDFSKNNHWSTPDFEAYDSALYGLPKVKESPGRVHFRLRFDHDIVDLTEDETGAVHGTLTQVITQYPDRKKRKWREDTERTEEEEKVGIFRKVDLDSVASKEMLNWLIQSGFGRLPDDSIKKHWTVGFHNPESAISRFRIGENFQEQRYPSPRYQPDSLPYVQLVCSTIDTLKERLQLNQHRSEFTKLLPRGETYSYNGYQLLYFMTEKEYEGWKKGQPRRDYLKSMRDTIDQFLDSALAVKESEPDGPDCFETYGLIFAANGRLEKVWVYADGRPKLSDGLSWYLDDRKEIRTCRRRIKRLFRDIDLSELNLQYPVRRDLSFDIDGQPELSDPNSY